MKTRGIKTVDFFYLDGLTVLKGAIQAVYPFAGIQRCIIHQIRSSTKYISFIHCRKFVADLKQIYTTFNEEVALVKLYEFKEK